MTKPRRSSHSIPRGRTGFITDVKGQHGISILNTFPNWLDKIAFQKCLNDFKPFPYIHMHNVHLKNRGGQGRERQHAPLCVRVSNLYFRMFLWNFSQDISKHCFKVNHYSSSIKPIHLGRTSAMEVDDTLKGIRQEKGITRDLMECQYINAPQQRVTYSSRSHIGCKMNSMHKYWKLPM